MKKLIQIFILFFTLNFGYSQNVLDLYYVIPDVYVGNLTESERRDLISNRELKVNDSHFESRFNLKKGYLRMESSSAKNKPVDFYIDIKYWTLEDGFLIAVSKTKMDNYNYQQVDFKFLLYKDGEISLVKKGYLDGYSSDFDVFQNNLWNFFLKDGISNSEKEMAKNANIFISFQYGRYDFYLQYSTKYEYWKFNDKIMKYIKAENIDFKFDYNDSKFIQLKNENPNF